LITWHVYNNQQKPWVAHLVLPYLLIFGVAAVVSAGTIILKGKLLVEKFRGRHLSVQSNAPALAQDATWREQWIAKMASQEQVYTDTEKVAIARALEQLDAFAVGIGQSRTRYDEQSMRMVGSTTLSVQGATPAQVAAYLMHVDSRESQDRLAMNVWMRVRLCLYVCGVCMHVGISV
jgi:hypothetical protein